MNWYYAQGDQQLGPVTESAFQTLVQAGTVNADTLVWHEGMAAWMTYRQATQPAEANRGASLAGMSCAECGAVLPPDQLVPLDGAQVCARCKPVALQRMLEGAGRKGNAEELRQQHLRHEAGIRSIGILYYLGGTLILIGGIAGAVAAATGGPTALANVIATAVLIALAGGLFCMGWGVRKFRPWARTGVGIISGIGLIGFPVGTLINGHILYLVFSQRGRVVFSEEYQAAIAQTPHIRYRTSIIVWIFVGLLVLLLLGGLMGAILSRGEGQ